jgi:hypothetical protein
MQSLNEELYKLLNKAYSSGLDNDEQYTLDKIISIINLQSGIDYKLNIPKPIIKSRKLDLFDVQFKQFLTDKAIEPGFVLVPLSQIIAYFELYLPERGYTINSRLMGRRLTALGFKKRQDSKTKQQSYFLSRDLTYNLITKS